VLLCPESDSPCSDPDTIPCVSDGRKGAPHDFPKFRLARSLHILYRRISRDLEYEMVDKALVAASAKPFVLSILMGGEDYGYQIIQRVKDLSGGELAWSNKMLYPVLHRMEKDGLLVSRWRISEEGRLRRYYAITEKGRRELDGERRQWKSVAGALAKLWKPLPSLE
jgi:DNA-binding PadR family transcriptional regulator